MRRVHREKDGGQVQKHKYERRISLKRYKRLSFAFFLIIYISVVTPAHAFALDDDARLPSGGNWPLGPEISASAAIVMEQSTGLILYAKDIYTTYYPASTTKVLTTLVALENSSLNEVVTVSYEAEWYVSKSSSRMGLVEGEQLTMEEALYGVMLESANEATYAVGEHVGNSVGRFIRMMNTKAAELGCVNSHFANTHGLHDDEHYTCCYDLALISQAAFDNETFRKITGTSTYIMPATNKTPERVMTNHHNFINKTMRYDYCIGGKTGATTQAKNSLVTYARKDGMTLVAVVMHADGWDRVYEDTQTVLDFAFDNYSIYDMSEANAADVAMFPSMFENVQPFSRSEYDNLRIGDSGNIVLPNGAEIEDVRKEVSLADGVTIEHGDNIIGTLSYTYDDRVVGRADIIYYNEGNPLTDKSFIERWPDYLIPVDVVFGDEQRDSILSRAEQKALEEAMAAEVNMIPVYIGIGAGALVLVIGAIVLKKKLS